MYIINETMDKFSILELETSIPNSSIIIKATQGFQDIDYLDRKALYGDKTIFQSPKRGIIVMLLTELIKPIYIFQVV